MNLPREIKTELKKTVKSKLQALNLDHKFNNDVVLFHVGNVSYMRTLPQANFKLNELLIQNSFS